MFTDFKKKIWRRFLSQMRCVCCQAAEVCLDSLPLLTSTDSLMEKFKQSSLVLHSETRETMKNTHIQIRSNESADVCSPILCSSGGTWCCCWATDPRCLWCSRGPNHPTSSCRGMPRSQGLKEAKRPKKKHTHITSHHTTSYRISHVKHQTLDSEGAGFSVITPAALL